MSPRDNEPSKPIRYGGLKLCLALADRGPKTHAENVSHSGNIEYRIDNVFEKDVPGLKVLFNNFDEQIKDEYFQLGHKAKEFANEVIKNSQQKR